MKKIALMVSLTLFITVSFSCVSVNDMVRQHFRSLQSNDEIIVVIFGDSTSGVGGIQEYGESYSSFLKLMLSDLFKCTVSMLNASMPGETYQIAHRRIQEDILSFRPDITFVMLGVNDAFQSGYLMSEHEKNVNNFYSILNKSKTFVIVLTAYGFRDFSNDEDPAAERLEEFNQITRESAKYYRLPIIDVGLYMENLRLSDPDEYRSMFSNTFMLNQKGNKYVADYIFSRITRVLGNSFEN